MEQATLLSTGLSGLDNIIDGLRKGDNVVWQVDEVGDYKNFVTLFVSHAIKSKKRLIYIRFAHHAPLIDKNDSVKIYNLDASLGFETFASKIHNIITKEGDGAFYIFDCLSDLLSAWATDLMIGNFFMVTCPYLFELNTIAYFAILRNRHSYKTVARIRETTQILLDLYNCSDSFYLHPLKVLNRYSPTMFLPHVQEGKRLIPITNSFDATKLYEYISKKEAERGERYLDHWEEIFSQARVQVERKQGEKENGKFVDNLCRIMIGRDEKMLDLARRYLSLEDLLSIKSRLIGSGFIGGKTLGMLIARNILACDKKIDWQNYLEHHDSFYVGSDVFYTYIVQNGWWKLFMGQKTKAGYFSKAKALNEKMRHGTFSDEIKEHFYQIIEYFGQSPIIVRSSSLLEDSYGNAFAGKYESIFLANQGTPEERYRKFEEAVRAIFASAMNENALAYRLQRGLDQCDEQMALLVQRVSGSHRTQSFFPEIGGVGISYNVFAWETNMDPTAGMLRLVVGLGTRAVNRVDGDYPRIVALDAPAKRPLADSEEKQKFSQHLIDVLNIKNNTMETIALATIDLSGPGIRRDLLGTEDEYEDPSGKRHKIWAATFEGLLTATAFIQLMRDMLKQLEAAYSYPVEIEFTVNFVKEDNIQINLLQCRPFQTKGQEARRVGIPKDVAREHTLFQSKGNFMGGSISQTIRRVIYVDPQKYGGLSLSGKYDIARLIGKINKQIKDKNETPAILLGPGRWGTTTPSMGIPVSFAEINNISVLVEISFQEGNLMPELSFGTHFFHDLVENDIFYVALFTTRKASIFNKKFFTGLENRLSALVPRETRYEEVVSVFDFTDGKLRLVADLVSQEIVCFRKKTEKSH